MAEIRFTIENTQYTNGTNVYSLLNAFPELLKIISIYYVEEVKIWEKINYDSSTYDISGYFNPGNSEKDIYDYLIINLPINELDASKDYYFTYNLVYMNESLPLSPFPHNYIYDDKMEYPYGRLLTNEDLDGEEDELSRQANAILNKWLTKDSLKIENILEDTHSHIIVNKDRKILLPSENTNILITKDNNSEKITFEIPRKYDKLDLISKNLSIYYIRPVAAGEDKPAGVKESLYLEEYDDETLYASWTITDKVTNTPGILTFAIIAEGNGYTDTYFWQTYPAQLRVDSGIYGDLPPTEESFAIVEFDEFQKELYNTIQSLKAFHEKGELKWQSITDLIEILDKQDTKSESED